MSASESASSFPIDRTSVAMRSVMERLSQVAGHEVPVLLRGESGTGKGLLARELHAASPRHTHSFVAIDCLGFLGSPPSALKELAARLEQARGGTAFLEEVAALPDRLQVAVASLLEVRERERTVPEFRVVAASRRDLEDATRAGKFHEALLSLLNVVEIRVPPLRERREDILPLAVCFLQKLARSAGLNAPTLGPGVERALLAYAWPGNISELRSALQRALVLSRGEVLDVESLPPRVLEATAR